MSNVLQFALGLETSKFISALGLSSQSVLSFAGVARAIGKVWQEVDGSMERAAGLQTLSARTGETVSTLYLLQKGFKAAGLDGESIATMMLRMQRSMSGMNEMGERTGSMFASLGVNIKQLAKQDALSQIQAITAALAKLPKGQATMAAFQLFGRFGAGDILQLTRMKGLFDEGVASGKKVAKVWEALAPAAFEFLTGLKLVKDKLNIVWAEIASRLLPVLIDVVKWAKKLDFSGAAEQAGNIASAIMQSFKDGSISKLLELTFAAGVEFMVNMIAGTLGSGGFWTGVFQMMTAGFMNAWTVIAKAFLSIGDLLIAGFDTAFQKLYELIGKTPKLGAALGLEGYKAKSFGENFSARRTDNADSQTMLDGVLKGGIGRYLSGAKDVGSAFKQAYATSGGDAQSQLSQFVSGLASRASRLPTKGSTQTVGSQELQKPDNYKPEFTSFEKMGFVMSGAGNPLAEFSKRTAIATERLVELLKDPKNISAGAMAAVNEL
jgi:hypothetical protein